MDIGFSRLLRRSLRTRPSYRAVTLFRDPAIQRSIERFGYCITDARLPEMAVVRLQQLVDGHRTPSDRADPYSLGWGPPPNISFDQYLATSQLLVPEVARLTDLEAARTLLSTFQIKPTGAGSYLPAHQDGFLVDERRWYGVNAWISLADSTSTTGALFVLPGSHRYGDWVRLGTSEDDLAGLHGVIAKHSRILTSTSGQIVLFDTALIHGSTTNSGVRRVAATCNIIPRQADLLNPSIGHATPPGYVEVHRTPVSTLDRQARSLDAGELPQIGDTEMIGRRPIDRVTIGRRGLDLVHRLDRALRPNPPGSEPSRTERAG